MWSSVCGKTSTSTGRDLGLYSDNILCGLRSWCVGSSLAGAIAIAVGPEANRTEEATRSPTADCLSGRASLS